MQKISMPKRVFQVLKGRWGDEISAVIASFCLWLIALAPLLALLYKGDKPLWIISLLTPLLIVFVVLPLRFSEAQAMRNFWNGDRFATGQMVKLDHYGTKLLCGLRHGLQVLFWAIPLFALVAYSLIMYFGGADGLTLMRGLQAIGMFFVGQDALAKGVYFTGIGVVLAVALFTVLVLIYGMVRLSVLRHVWALDESQSTKDAWKNMKGILRKKRHLQWLQFGFSLLCFLPFFISLGFLVKDVPGAVMKMSLSVIKQQIIITGALFAVCAIFTMPVRRLMPKAMLERAMVTASKGQAV